MSFTIINWNVTINTTLNNSTKYSYGHYKIRILCITSGLSNYMFCRFTQLRCTTLFRYKRPPKINPDFVARILLPSPTPLYFIRKLLNYSQEFLGFFTFLFSVCSDSMSSNTLFRFLLFLFQCGHFFPRFFKYIEILRVSCSDFSQKSRSLQVAFLRTQIRFDWKFCRY